MGLLDGCGVGVEVAVGVGDGPGVFVAVGVGEGPGVFVAVGERLSTVTISCGGNDPSLEK